MESGRWRARATLRTLTGLRPYLFHFLSSPPCLLVGASVQMGTSGSHSPPPNWHLTAAPHGLLAGCISARFSPRRKQRRHITHHPAERALSPAPFTPFTPASAVRSPFPSLAAIMRGKPFAPETAPSAHYHSSQSACRSEIHPSSPQPVAHLHLRLFPRLFPHRTAA